MPHNLYNNASTAEKLNISSLKLVITKGKKKKKKKYQGESIFMSNNSNKKFGAQRESMSYQG